MYTFENKIKCLKVSLLEYAVVKNEGEPGGGPFWVKGIMMLFLYKL
jgi:hypothetical protein